MTVAPAHVQAERRPPSPPLPPKVAHYLRQFLAGRFRLVPTESAPPRLKGRALVFAPAQLERVPESPQFQDTLRRLDGRGRTIQGWLQTDPGGAPVVFLDGLGAWTLRLPRHGRSYQSLRELRTPDDLRPVRTYEDPPQNGRPWRRRHVIPLRYHPGAFLVVAVMRYASGHIGYEAWIWHAQRKLTIPLSWEEARRCLDLFRDMVASWFQVAGAPGPKRSRLHGPANGETPAEAPEDAAPVAGSRSGSDAASGRLGPVSPDVGAQDREAVCEVTRCEP